MNVSPLTAPVNKIIPFSLVDGPGNRAAVFLQGCGFCCGYCHNPETQNLCSHCGICVPHCPAGALQSSSGQVIWIKENCVHCDACIKVCPHNASPRVENLSAEAILLRLQSSLPFISGVTVSGGECTRYKEFLCDFLPLVRARGKTAFLDTNGERLFEAMPDLCRVMDAAMLDVKSTNAAEHRDLYGHSVEPVMKNLEFLARTGKLYEVRTVVAPALLHVEQTVRDVAKIIAQYPPVRYKLIRFRTIGAKGRWAKETQPDDSLMQTVLEIAKREGVRTIEVV